MWLNFFLFFVSGVDHYQRCLSLADTGHVSEKYMIGLYHLTKTHPPELIKEVFKMEVDSLEGLFTRSVQSLSISLPDVNEFFESRFSSSPQKTIDESLAYIKEAADAGYAYAMSFLLSLKVVPPMFDDIACFSEEIRQVLRSHIERQEYVDACLALIRTGVTKTHMEKMLSFLLRAQHMQAGGTSFDAIEQKRLVFSEAINQYLNQDCDLVLRRWETWFLDWSWVLPTGVLGSVFGHTVCDQTCAQARGVWPVFPIVALATSAAGGWYVWWYQKLQNRREWYLRSQKENRSGLDIDAKSSVLSVYFLLREFNDVQSVKDRIKTVPNFVMLQATVTQTLGQFTAT